MGPEGGRAESVPWPFWVSVGYLLVVLIWGTTWYGIHTQVNGTSPHIGVALRMGAASLIFVVIGVATKQPWRLTVSQMRLVAIAGMCFFGLNYLAAYAGSQYLTSGVVAVILSLTVPLNLFAEWVIRGQRPNVAMIVAATLGMGGISLVFGSELENALSGGMRWWGAGVVASSAILVAIGNVISAELMSTRLSWIVVNAFGMAIGCVVTLAWGAVAGSPWVIQPTASWLMGYAYLVLLGSVAAFGIYMKILPTIGTTAGAYVTVLSPVLALLVSAALEGFSIRPTTYAGVALLLLGHTFLIRQRSRTPPA